MPSVFSLGLLTAPKAVPLKKLKSAPSLFLYKSVCVGGGGGYVIRQAAVKIGGLLATELQSQRVTESQTP